MPLQVADSNGAPPSLTKASESEYLIFYSSIVNGRLWCPDCIAVEELVKDTFSSDGSPSALIIYVGDRSTWKSPSNTLRGEPWRVQSVPTIMKVKNGKEVKRLVDSEITSGLTNFIKS
ncbi:hypothetical protein BDP27DRAFT_1287038 [Rhodocollybia butyracea]|uniref:Thioredoxin domain-containing protein n=1 Tax=Rhodocollybia butyracea TaxID=206335 RepID=A0A9P5Q776_9AGAR|nr:hypothetical protein BDP27DRAFT_1287038 [Rhodocollybia butyracea]